MPKKGLKIIRQGKISTQENNPEVELVQIPTGSVRHWIRTRQFSNDKNTGNIQALNVENRHKITILFSNIPVEITYLIIINSQFCSFRFQVPEYYSTIFITY